MVLRKIIKIVATRCLDFLSQNAPKCVWRPGSARTRWGSLSAPPDPLAAKKGPTSKGRGREGKGEGRGEKRKEREGMKRGSGGEGKEEEGRGGKGRKEALLISGQRGLFP